MERWFCVDDMGERTPFENAIRIVKHKVCGTRIIRDYIQISVGETGCLRKGTLLMTPYGPMPIECVSVVCAVDNNGVVIPVVPKVISSGTKKLLRIHYENGFVDCSTDHTWFIIKNGKIEETTTNKLRKGDRLIQVRKNKYATQMQSMWQKFRASNNDSEILFGSLSWQGAEYLPIRNEQSNILPYRGFTNDCYDEGIHRTECDSLGTRKEIQYCSPDFIETIQRTGNYSTPIRGICEYRHNEEHTQIPRSASRKEEWCVHSWKTSRAEEEPGRILVDYQDKQGMEMRGVQSTGPSMQEWSSIRVVSASQGWKQQEQFVRQLDGLVPSVSHEITHIEVLGKEKTFDLIVDDYHNFLLADGTITHNSGKSSCNLSEAIALDPTFIDDMENRVAFDSDDYIEKVDRLVEAGHSRGKVAMLEEVGVTASNKKYGTAKVQRLTTVMQTVRSTGIIMLMSVPDDAMFVKDGRRLNKATWAMEKISEEGYILVRPFINYSMPAIDKRGHFFMEVDTGRATITLDMIKVPFAPPEVWAKYQALMEAFKSKVRKQAIAEAKKSVDLLIPPRKARCVHVGCIYNIGGWTPRDQKGDYPPGCPQHHKANWIE